MPLSVFSLILCGVIASVVYRFISNKIRPTFLVVVSLFVYVLWAGLYALMVFVIDSIISLLIIDRIVNGRNKKGWLGIGIAVTVLCLAIHKYYHFWVTDEDHFINIIMPLGISYYSFKIISYMVDVYRGDINDHSPVKCLSYISFFPQIVCGPISRQREINNYYNITVTHEDIQQGLFMILKGLFYKAVIADRLSSYTATIFGEYEQYGFLALWMAVFFNAIELYCDFAGYSFIVIGISRFFGFRIENNFNNPYFSRNIREFWNRWHISFSKWTRDYIYIPLGGNRKGTLRKRFNILIVYIISGLWHGNTILYAIWGLWHGIWNIMSPTRYKNKMLEVTSIFATFWIFAIGQITFRLERISDLKCFIKGMLAIRFVSFSSLVETVLPFSEDYSSVAKFSVALILIIILFILEYRENRGLKVNRIIRMAIYITGFILFGIVGQSNFIYANF